MPRPRRCASTMRQDVARLRTSRDTIDNGFTATRRPFATTAWRCRRTNQPPTKRCQRCSTSSSTPRACPPRRAVLVTEQAPQRHARRQKAISPSGDRSAVPACRAAYRYSVPAPQALEEMRVIGEAVRFDAAGRRARRSRRTPSRYSAGTPNGRAARACMLSSPSLPTTERAVASLSRRR